MTGPNNDRQDQIGNSKYQSNDPLPHNVIRRCLEATSQLGILIKNLTLRCEDVQHSVGCKITKAARNCCSGEEVHRTREVELRLLPRLPGTVFLIATDGIRDVGTLPSNHFGFVVPFTRVVAKHHS